MNGFNKGVNVFISIIITYILLYGSRPCNIQVITTYDYRIVGDLLPKILKL